SSSTLPPYQMTLAASIMDLKASRPQTFSPWEGDWKKVMRMMPRPPKCEYQRGRSSILQMLAASSSTAVNGIGIRSDACCSEYSSAQVRICPTRALEIAED